MAIFDFYPLTIPYLQLMHQWLQEPHVRAFWDEGDRTLDQVRARYFSTATTERYLILHQKQPVGYIQAHPVQANHPLVKFCPKEQEAFSVDLFLGEASLIGKGMAVALLNDFIHYLKERHHQLQAVLFTPSENNPRAIHLFVKLGAKTLGLFEKKEVLLFSVPDKF
jgi:aminoglycoside 6'-N-acetyltransferase